MGTAAIPALSWVALASTAVSAGVSAYGQYQSSRAAKAAGKAQNRLAQQQAENEARTAAENAKRHRERNRRLLAAMHSRLAASGTVTSAGSPLELLQESESELELQVQDLFREGQARYTANLNAGRMSEWEATQRSIAARYQAVGTLFSGAGQVAGGYVDFRNTGAIGGPQPQGSPYLVR